MYSVLDSAAMRSAEERVAAALGTDLAGLMELAGRALAEEAMQRAPEGRIGVAIGPGNNGGDGWVAARALHTAGRDVVAWTTRSPAELDSLARDAASRAVAAGVVWSAPGTLSAEELAECACVVDALLGTGSSGPARAPLSEWVDAINASGAYVLAADVPTGVDSDTGAVDGRAVDADATVVMLALKPGLLLFPGTRNAGEIVLATLGAPQDALDSPGAPEVWGLHDLRAALPLPAPDAHKNARGRLLVVAGSAAYPGAAVLAVRGAQRAGAGYVTLAIPEAAVSAAHAHLVSAPVIAAPQTGAGTFSSRAARPLLDLARDYDAVVLGPGLTLTDGAVAFVRAFAARVPVPLVVDADGLNALVDAPGILAGREAPTIITPHPGEAARLLGMTTSHVQANRLSCSASLAELGGGVAALKGAHTVISGGGRLAINTSGGPALATAGTGDVFAGVVGALVAQGAGAYQAAVLGAWLHGRAGDVAASELTPMAVNAEDVPEYLPAAIAELLGEW